MNCIELPKIPTIPNIKLLGGAELKAFLDFSQGSATNCKLTFNLLLQLAPLLASMACLLKMLNVIGKLKDFVEAVPNPAKIAQAAPSLISAIGELSPCIPALAIPQLLLMLKGIIRLVIDFLSCFISQLDSILKFQASIDFKAAEGNPVLLDALVCAKSNSNTSMDNLMGSLQSLQPILDMVVVVGSIGGKSIKLPTLSEISVEADPTKSISSLRDAVDALKKVVDSLPG